MLCSYVTVLAIPAFPAGLARQGASGEKRQSRNAPEAQCRASRSDLWSADFPRT